MSNPASSASTSKTVNTSPQIPSPSQSQFGYTSGAENYPQRRSGGTGSFGAGSVSRASPSVSRNNQSLRKQHKGQRRPRLADEDAAAESAAMQSTNSRKGRTSITHLMNFTLPPRPQNHSNSHHHRNFRKNPTWGLGSGYHAIDKAKYVHANYRFVVDPKGDYRAQAMDADVHLDWNCVLQILASAQSQSASCPICLSTPSAPRMAKCGHIFCLPCLIRYMHSTDDTIPHPEKKARWKKCPICWDSVYISETRPVRWFTGQEGEAPREGGDVVLRLMSRMVGSTLALPRDGAESLERVDDIPWFFAAEVMDYARVMKGNEDYMTAQYNAELIDLQRQEREDELMFGEDTMWTQKAISAILEARGKLKGMGGSPYASKQSIEKSPKRIPLRFREPTEAGPDYNFIQHVAKAGQSLPLEVHTSYSGEPFSNQTLEKNAMTAMLDDENIPKYSEPAESSKSDVSQSTMKAKDRDKNPTTSQLKGRSEGSCHQVLNDSPFYFYEALLHYYLSPLDIRILKAAFGDFSSFPTTVLPRVERVSTGHIIDDELRRRAKYLAHLPHGCEVGFLECDWTDIVSAEVLDSFSVEICRRRKKNREKELREEKERIRAEKEEDDKRWAAARRKRPTSTQETMMSAEFQALPLLEDGSDNSPSIEIATGSSPPWGSSRTHPGSAFASLASPSTSPAASRTVWGTTAIAPTSPVISTKAIEPDPSVNDGWLPNWERDLLQEDELNADFEVSPVGGIISKVGAASANSKRKKGKKITLMTTNARRGA